MLMLPSLFDREKPQKTKAHYERFNQYIKFQSKEGNIKDAPKEAIELFEYTLDKKALIGFQQHWLLHHPLYKAQEQFLVCIHTWHNLKIKMQIISLNHLKVLKLKDKRNQER